MNDPNLATRAFRLYNEFDGGEKALARADYIIAHN